MRRLVIAGATAALLLTAVPLASSASAATIGPDSAACVEATKLVDVKADAAVNLSLALSLLKEAQLGGLQDKVEALQKQVDAALAVFAASPSVSTFAAVLNLQTELDKAIAAVAAAAAPGANAQVDAAIKLLTKARADLTDAIEARTDKCKQVVTTTTAAPTPTTVPPTTTAAPSTTVVLPGPTLFTRAPATTVVLPGNQVTVVPNDAPETGDGSTE